MTKVRFAPSPTGRLHLGNARTALVNWLFARKTGGRFLLRLDDTDRERSRPEFAEAIETDLRWLGLDWDEFGRQSDRIERYAIAAERLRAAGRIYPCFESQEELDLKRKLAQQRGKPWIYDRAGLDLSPEEVQRRLLAHEVPHWRFKLEDRRVAWTDLVRGPVEFHGEHLSDPVLIRADGLPLYTFSSVVDDGELGVTHVIRGEDHVTNTAYQIQIFEALAYAVPEFAHLSLITGKGGEALSKRMDSLSLASLREAGIEAMAINSLLAKLGTSDAVEPRLDLAGLVAEFDFAKFGRAQPHLDPAELDGLNAKLLHQTPFETVGSGFPPAPRPSSGPPCAPTSPALPTPATGGRSAPARSRLRSCRRKPRFSPRPPSCCPRSLSTARPGRPGPERLPPPAAARAERSTSRSAWRSRRGTMDRSCRRCCP